MLNHRSYLHVVVTMIASTVVVIAILAAITGYLLTNTATGLPYFIIVGLALFSLFVSLGFGCYGMIKSLSMLGCDQWNIRLVNSGFVIQVVLLCIGLLCYLLSLFFIR